jgi:hypothetical protein
MLKIEFDRKADLELSFEIAGGLEVPRLVLSKIRKIWKQQESYNI